MSSSALPTLRKKNALYQSNVNKRGQVKSTLKPKPGFKLPVSYGVLAVLAFALVGGGNTDFIVLVYYYQVD
ncbi:hypothetical protein BC941DRAFT_427695 [Chlamydoabsidia padenii]|nr:hypothetical protein BC941DRAFT_427695 [Chlamydoabsidia padenii]